jgi:NTP pyrophosphatase (non-canonical NTP hydrolase)
MTELVNKISKWHLDRQITVNGSSLTQTVKLGEEFGELCSAIVRGDKDLIKDSIGDMVVVLVAIAELEGTSITECVKDAYNEIKDRKGKLLPNGTFVKEEELNKIVKIKLSGDSMNVLLGSGSDILVMVELTNGRYIPETVKKEFVGKDFEALKAYLNTLGRVTTL